MKLKQISKNIITALVFIFTILMLTLTSNAVSVYGGNDGNTLIELYPGLEFRFRFATVFDKNPNVYCVERGKQFPDRALYYKVSEKLDVTDPLFLYILNLPDLQTQMATRWNTYVKQNLIWWYMGNYNTRETEFIRAQGTNHGTNKPAMVGKTEFEEEKQRALNYASTYNNSYSIGISNMYIDGDNVIVNIAGNFKKYKIYINDGEYYGENTATSISIPLSRFTGGKAKVKLAGIRDKYTASLYVLRRDDSQKLICIFNKGTQEEVFSEVGSEIPFNIDVSLQKYITEVNGKSLVNIYNNGDKTIVDQNGLTGTSQEDKMLGRWAKKATSSSINEICAGNNGSRAEGLVASQYRSNNFYKINKPVNIEKGDIVTYNIYVYNNDSERAVQDITVTDYLLYVNSNQSDGSQIYIDDNNIKITSLTLEVQGRDSGSTYITKSTNADAYYIEDGKIKVKAFSLGAGETARITVKVKFNYQYNGEIKNYAKLYVDNNKTTKRTADADYIKMKAYKVSLEKYISGVNSEGSTSVNMSVYSNILAYLRSHKDVTLDELINRNKEISAEYTKYDLNNDKKVDAADLAIYNSINKNVSINEINKYINADINGDGVVNDKDLDAYKILKANLNNDTSLNEYDRYIFILKSLFDDELINDEVLNYLYIQSLLIKENKTVIEIRDEYDSYTKSDLDGDGYVRSQDAYKVVNGKLLLDGAEFELKISNIIKNLQERDILILENNLEKYDVNEDGILNNSDIEIIREYNDMTNETSKYHIVSRIRDIQAFITEFEEEFKKRAPNSQYNINNDNFVYFDDYFLLKELCEFNKDNEIYKTLLEELEDKLTLENESAYDLNGDGKSNHKDYEILREYISAKSKIEELDLSSFDSYGKINVEKIENFINNYNIVDLDTNISEFTKEDINTIKVYKGWKLYNSKYDMDSAEYNFNYDLYDLNKDGIINDKDIVDEFYHIQISSIINDILNSEDIDKFIELFKNVIENKSIVSNLKIEYKDIDASKENLVILKDIINKLDSKANDVLSNIEPDKITNITFNDIKTAMNLTNLDVNGDKKVNQSDIKYLESVNGIENVSKITDIKKQLEDNDLNGDGAWDNNDIVLSNELKQVAANQEIKDAILNQGTTEEINEELKERPGKAEHNYDDTTNTNNYWKYNNVVDVGNGDKVTYTIKVTNDSTDTSVYISEITDYLPDGIKYGNTTYNGGQYDTKTDNEVKFTNLSGTLLAPGESASFTVTVEVVESNMSINILKNTAKITQMKNKNNIEVNDSTPNDNEDSDYIQLKDITISGVVWNDRAFDKNATDYNGKYDYENNKEVGISGIKVYLYRVINNSVSIVETTTTNLNGQYSFRLNYIKAPKNADNNRWNNSNGHYSYYIVFEYDGIKYTSTTFADLTSNDKYDSNAKEDNGQVKEYRKTFNNRFSTINNSTGMNYTTLNEEGYIPQSNHKYDSNKMGIQASTNKITLSNNADLEQQLEHVNLGLRGRDTFDLELTSDIFSTRVSVNGQVGEYNYGNNVITVRKSDIKAGEYTIGEDASNVSREIREGSISRVDQDIRMTDIKNEVYEDTKLGIEVTYKLTIKNASKTDGTATKVADYYDNRYTFVKAYDENGNILNVAEGESGSGFKSVVITTNQKKLTQKDAFMEIYLVYNLNRPTDTLKALLEGTTEIPTFNLAEVLEYKTYLAAGQTEYTRGLIDIDSAPGSANKEQVRLTTTQGQDTATTGGNPTTVGYYFGENDLTKLKYEDDTYTAPTLYFVSSDNQRIITGTVFRDNTTTDSVTKIKTGNGKLDRGEVGVYGAQVALLEQVSEDEWKARYITTTNEDGTYTFRGFLPGKYIIQYYYGNKIESVLLNQAGSVNKYSYNGEDYQSTNNTGSYGSAKLNDILNYWYLYNEVEGVSVAKDVESRRNTVSNNVTGFIDEEMKVLNNMRDGKNFDEAKVTYTTSGGQRTITVNDVIEKTWMYANTQSMLFNVEKSMLDNNSVKATAEFGPYNITNMNFGLSEVPVTTIDLQKHVKEFSITDSTGTNVIASMKYEDGRWKLKGDVILASDDIDISIEDDKLQGARLEVTYNITVNMTTEKNFDNKSLTVPTITGIVDYINNNFSYDESLGDNSRYWELTTYQEIKQIYASQKWKDGTTPQGTVDPDGKTYTTIAKAKSDNPLLLTTEGTGSATITLEKVLTSTDSTIEDIITSVVDSFEYYNLIEITGLDYNNVTPEGEDGNNDGDTPQNPDNSDDSNPDGTEPQRDRIRTPDRYIIVPGVQYDNAISETIVIHPPTGDSSISIVYYVIAAVSLVILAVGAFGIKRFVLNK